MARPDMISRERLCGTTSQQLATSALVQHARMLHKPGRSWDSYFNGLLEVGGRGLRCTYVGSRSTLMVGCS